VDAINSRGSQLTGITGDFTVPVTATTDPGEIGRADMCIVQFNTYATDEAGRVAAEVLGEDGSCLTLQNGVGNIETLTERLGQKRVVGGLSYHSGVMEGPGARGAYACRPDMARRDRRIEERPPGEAPGHTGEGPMALSQ
jgi:2-dehydropantoate 2-reductase